MTTPRTIELTIGGMTCASCAARVEKKLNKLDGVVATVNYATEKAAVAFTESITTQDLVATRRGHRLYRDAGAHHCTRRPCGAQRRGPPHLSVERARSLGKLNPRSA